MTTLETRPSNDARLDGWLAAIERAVASVVEPGRPVALVNYPNHGNPGDPAIWLGTLVVLRRLGCDVAYTCNPTSYHPEALQRALPEGPVLLNGGGNFGDLYRPQQALRERLLAELHGRALVQLPQSMHFRDSANLDRVRRLVSDHGQVTLMVREDQSASVAASFDVPVVSCPDLALALGPLVRPREADTDVLWLHRQTSSPEYVDHGGLPHAPGLRSAEWLATLADDERLWPLTDRAVLDTNAKQRALTAQSDEWRRDRWQQLAATFTPLATAWVRRGLDILSSGQVVVTERLHGHLLCLLLGIPHVVLDNAYGKCGSTLKTWTGEHPLVRSAGSTEEALALARDLSAGITS